MFSDNRLLAFAGSLEELVKHGLRALRDTLPSEVNLNTKVSTGSCFELLGGGSMFQPGVEDENLVSATDRAHSNFMHCLLPFKKLYCFFKGIHWHLSQLETVQAWDGFNKVVMLVHQVVSREVLARTKI